MREAIAARFPQLMVDELEEATAAQRAVARRRWRPAAAQQHLYAIERDDTAWFNEVHAGGNVIALEQQFREPQLRFWRCTNERAQAQAVARDVEHLLATGTSPEEICVLVEDPAAKGGPVAAAMEERGIPFHLSGPAALFQRPEVRDAIAWLRVLADPGDSAAAARALTRPPVELRSADLARLTTIARRRKLDMVSACEAALESPQIPPEARERIQSFLKLYGEASAAMEERRADVFVRRLIERVGLRRQRLFAAQPEVAERLLGLSRLADLATAWARREPHGSTRDFVRYLSAVAEAGVEPTGGEEPPSPGSVIGLDRAAAKGREFARVFVLGLEDGSDAERIGRPARAGIVLSRVERDGDSEARPSPFYEQALAATAAVEEEHAEELFGPAEGLHATYRRLREEVLEASWKAGRELSEPRLDTAVDVNRAIARYLELLKLAALAQRPGDEATAEAIEAVNGLLRQVATAEQQTELDASALDSYLLGSERDRDSRRRLISARHEPSLEAFLPRRGDGGLSLSASDLDLYLTCPLKYKFARVFGIPQEPTINQRFGILIHNVLERFHKEEPEPGRRRPAAPDGPARGGLAALRLRHQRRRAAVPRPGPRGDAPLLGARARGRGRTDLAGEEVRLQDRAPPRARPGRPGRPAAGRRARADRLQDRRAQERGAAGERPAAGALPARGARGLGSGYAAHGQLLLRARRRQGRRAEQARRRGAGRAHGAAGRRGGAEPGLRAAALA